MAILAMRLIMICLMSSCSNQKRKSACLVKHSGDWDYSIDYGPGKWAEVNPDFRLCGLGKH